MNNFKTTVGIEVHTVVNSKSKMFSAVASKHNDETNTNINEIDIGLPGTMPSVNEFVVQKAICLANALHMKISKELTFDRKNYFYRDLPKGFQITQQFNPIGLNGYVEITLPSGSKKKIRVERIHMEEDTAKQIIQNDKVLLDYNRAGMPLIEIVSHPDIDSSEEAMAYLTELKRILNFAEISDAKMEDGSLRADVNISVAPYGSKTYGTRVEIKNINSISGVGKAIEYEQERQAGQYLLGKNVLQETRKYDDVKEQTLFMREKTVGVDYHFIPEPNILCLELDDSFIEDAKKQVKYSVDEIKQKLFDLKLDSKLVYQLLDDYPLYKTFNKVLEATNDANAAITWILVELVGLLKKDNKTIESISSKKIDYIIDMIKILKQGSINAKQSKSIIAEIYKSDLSPKEIIEKFGFKQITDEKEIAIILNSIIEKNKDMILKNKDRLERVEKMIIGQLMKETKGQANPIISNKVLKDLLKK